MTSDGVGSVVGYSGSSALGRWHQMPRLNRLDHLAVVGVALHTQVLKVHAAHATLLASLPTVSKLDAAITSLADAATSVETTSDLEALCKSPANSYAENYCANRLEAATRVAKRELPALLD